MYLQQNSLGIVQASPTTYTISVTLKPTDMKTTKTLAKYVGEEYTYSSDIRLAIETLQLPKIEEPPDAKGNVLKLSEFMWQEEARDYI